MMTRAHRGIRASRPLPLQSASTVATEPARKAMETVVKVSRRQGNWAKTTRRSTSQIPADRGSISSMHATVAPWKKSSCRRTWRSPALITATIDRMDRTRGIAPNCKGISSWGPGWLVPKPHRGEKS